MAKILRAAFLLVLANVCAQRQANAENYNAVLAALQSSNWHGSFTSGPGGAPTCYGSIDVRFLSLRREPFAGGAQTVSYRHVAHFSALTPFMPFCETIGTSMSAVNVAGCEKTAPTARTVENGHSVTVPVRTLIARDGGANLVVSTPTCVQENGKAVIKRLEFSVRSIEFTDPQKRSLRMTLGLGAVVSNYQLQRVGK
jgi:hypothetical protein